ncbi:MAG: cytidylate kinase-like family protein [Candidatus Sumerlaeaceae bacterium]|nr:cytidylate kinase-like family protein [Candidatus Sumerlaeaceae bacterium]
MKSMSDFIRAYSAGLASHDIAPARKKYAPPVVVSREIGSGGRFVARALAERLGFELCDKAILEEIASKSKAPKDLVEMLDEKPGRAMEVFGANLLHGVSMTREDYDRLLKATIHALLDLGNVVILGRGAAFLAEPGKVLRLRLVAPFEMRVANLARYLNIDEHDARKQIHAIEEERHKFHLRLFGKGETSPENFDMGLNMQCLTIDDAVELALDAYNRICKKA